MLTLVSLGGYGRWAFDNYGEIYNLCMERYGKGTGWWIMISALYGLILHGFSVVFVNRRWNLSTAFS
jgi:hypothetical protein